MMETLKEGLDLFSNYHSPNTVLCMNCLQPGALIRVSKKGLPYVTCSRCRTRTFWGSPEAVKGYLLLAPEVIGWMRQQYGGSGVTAAEQQRYKEYSEHFGAIAEQYQQRAP